VSTINRFLPLAAAVLLLSGTYAANAEVLNVEFKFTPFIGDTKQDHVESVPGKAKCLDKAYAAGVRMAPPSPAELEFVTTGNPEIVVRRKEGPLFQPDQRAFARIKGDELQMCADMLISLVYPPQLTAAHKPDGLWEAVD